jgi:hypothetical protein
VSPKAGTLVLPSNVSAARPKKLRFAPFNLAGKIASRAGDIVLRMSAAADVVNSSASR